MYKCTNRNRCANLTAKSYKTRYLTLLYSIVIITIGKPADDLKSQKGKTVSRVVSNAKRVDLLPLIRSIAAISRPSVTPTELKFLLDLQRAFPEPIDTANVEKYLRIGDKYGYGKKPKRPPL